MSKPLPIIYLPNRAGHERLIRGLYRMGYRSGTTRGNWSEDKTWGEWLETPGFFVCPYIHERGYMTSSTRLELCPDHTLVNSISHFLSYARTLRVEAPIVPHPTAIIAPPSGRPMGSSI